jgi:hypothetical protein
MVAGEPVRIASGWLPQSTGISPLVVARGSKIIEMSQKGVKTNEAFQSTDTSHLTQMILKLTNSHHQSGRYLQRALHVATGLLGWQIPDTAAVVKAASLQDEDVHRQLPKELQDPFAVLDRDRRNFPPAPMHCCNGSQVTVERLSLNLLAEDIVNAE